MTEPKLIDLSPLIRDPDFHPGFMHRTVSGHPSEVRCGNNRQQEIKQHILDDLAKQFPNRAFPNREQVHILTDSVSLYIWLGHLHEEALYTLTFWIRWLLRKETGGRVLVKINNRIVECDRVQRAGPRQIRFFEPDDQEFSRVVPAVDVQATANTVSSV